MWLPRDNNWRIYSESFSPMSPGSFRINAFIWMELSYFVQEISLQFVVYMTPYDVTRPQLINDIALGPFSIPIIWTKMILSVIIYICKTKWAIIAHTCLTWRAPLKSSMDVQLYPTENYGCHMKVLFPLLILTNGKNHYIWCIMWSCYHNSSPSASWNLTTFYTKYLKDQSCINNDRLTWKRFLCYCTFVGNSTNYRWILLTDRASNEVHILWRFCF